MQTKISQDVIDSSKLLSDAPNDDSYYVRHGGQWINMTEEGVPGGGGSGGSATGPSNAVEAPSGRRYYRHSSGLGCVMISSIRSSGIFIADAKYRSVQAFGAYGTDSDLPNYTSTPKSYLSTSNAATTTAAAKTIGDDWLNANILIDTNTSKYNSDVWAKIADTAAVAFCRNMNIDGQPCSLPNIQTLCRIYCDAVFIDSIDPTVANYASYALTDWFKGTNYAWSSTEYNSGSCWNVRSNGYVDHHYVYGKNDSYGVVPVLEL